MCYHPIQRALPKVLEGWKMGKPPRSCPMCHSVLKWKKVDKQRKGLSAWKAVVGGVVGSMFAPVAVPIGAIAGAALGKKRKSYYCGKCGFHHDY